MGEQMKKMKAKIIHKYETEADWELSNYVPDVGEIVFYDIDETYNYVRQKNGDGIHTVKDLPFSTGASDFDLVITSEEGFRKCLYMLHPNKNEDDSVDLTTKGEANPDFNYHYILVRDVNFTEDLGTSDLDLAIFQPSVRYVKFDNCQWHCQWWISGEEPSTLNSATNPTEYKRAEGDFDLILDGIVVTEDNVRNSLPTVEDPERYYYIGLRNIGTIQNCHIDYPDDYALVEYDYEGEPAYRYSFKFNLQYFDNIHDCTLTALWDGKNVNNCRITERIVRCKNCSNLVAKTVRRGDDLTYRVQLRESSNISNVSGNWIYTSCTKVDGDTCDNFGAASHEYDLIITSISELSALESNTTAKSVLVSVPTQINATARVNGFFDNDSSNEAYYSKFVIPKNVKYIKFTEKFKHNCPRVIIQGHEDCIIDGFPTIQAPYQYTNSVALYNFKEARNCRARTQTVQIPLKGINLKDLLNTSDVKSISTEGYLENSTEYKVSFDLTLSNTQLEHFVYVSDNTDSILQGPSISVNGHYEFIFTTESTKANTVQFSVGYSTIDPNITGTFKISNVIVERVDGNVTFVNKINGIGNVLLGTPTIAKYPQLAPDRTEQKTKFINCDLGVIDGADAIENCTVQFFSGITDATGATASQIFSNVKRINGLDVSYSRQDKVTLKDCENISSVSNSEKATIVYTNCSKIDTQSCDNIDNPFALSTDLNNYATEKYVEEAVSNVKVDLTGYATEKYVDDKIGDIESILTKLHEGGIV